jgi:hypothetical protein
MGVKILGQGVASPHAKGSAVSLNVGVCRSLHNSATLFSRTRILNRFTPVASASVSSQTRAYAQWLLAAAET